MLRGAFLSLVPVLPIVFSIGAKTPSSESVTASVLQSTPPAKAAKPPENVVSDRFIIVFPPGFDPANKLTPVVFALHGHGGDMDGMAHVWRPPCAESGAILVVCQGSIPLDTGGWSWSGFEDAGKAIDAARAALRKVCKLDASAPRVLTGMSQGTWATYSLALRYPKTYRRIIPVAGMFQPRSYQPVPELTGQELEHMKRWRVFMMVGAKDRNELVANNRWLFGQLERAGAAVLAPFTAKRDPSYSLYAEAGHEFPGDGETRTKELVRALRFVLQPDEQDRRNWSAVDERWPSRAKWLEDAGGGAPKAGGAGQATTRRG